MGSQATVSSPLGDLTVIVSERGVTALTMAGQKYEKRHLTEARREGSRILSAATAWLRDYFAGRDPGDPPPLDPAGSEFQRRVWRELREIPLGETVTYGQIARRLGTSARAVGGAVGRNPVAILIPCHRVVGEKGLTGYAGGVDRKAWLLRWERSIAAGEKPRKTGKELF